LKEEEKKRSMKKSRKRPVKQSLEAVQLSKGKRRKCPLGIIWKYVGPYAHRSLRFCKSVVISMFAFSKSKVSESLNVPSLKIFLL
jgi:hypothetical protein